MNASILGDGYMAIKMGSSTTYLGANDFQAREFSSISELISYATELEVAEVVVITGAAPWEF